MSHEVVRAYELINSGENAEARTTLQRVLAESRRSGQDSSYVLWCLAVASDNLEDHENSTRYIQEAIALDPLSPQLRQSFEIIARNVRQAMTAQERAVHDPEIRVLYEMLLRMSEADLDCHLRMVDHHIAFEELREARELLEALAGVFPASPRVWDLLDRLAQQATDASTVERCAKTRRRLAQPNLPTFRMKQAEA
jgi:hypothetical protein